MSRLCKNTVLHTAFRLYGRHFRGLGVWRGRDTVVQFSCLECNSLCRVSYRELRYARNRAGLCLRCLGSNKTGIFRTLLGKRLTGKALSRREYLQYREALYKQAHEVLPVKVGFHVHHVIPLGICYKWGKELLSYSVWNLVHLTPEEHKFVHKGTRLKRKGSSLRRQAVGFLRQIILLSLQVSSLEDFDRIVVLVQAFFLDAEPVFYL